MEDVEARGIYISTSEIDSYSSLENIHPTIYLLYTVTPGSTWLKD